MMVATTLVHSSGLASRTRVGCRSELPVNMIIGTTRSSVISGAGILPWVSSATRAWRRALIVRLYLFHSLSPKRPMQMLLTVLIVRRVG